MKTLLIILVAVAVVLVAAGAFHILSRYLTLD